MCTGGEIAMLALAAGGTYMQQQSADDAADDRRRIIDQAAAETEQLNKKKAQTIEEFAEKTYDPTARDSRYEEAATKQEGSLVDALVKANAGNGGGEVSNATEGSLSSDYVRGRGAATAAATEDILKRAKLMGRSAAAGNMFNDEMLKGGQLSSDIAGINSNINRANRNASTQLGRVGDKGSLVAGLLTGAAPMVGAKVGGLSKEWSSAMDAMGG